MCRILLITNIFPPHIGGPATFIDGLAHGLSRLGHKVTVVCSSDRAIDYSDRERPFHVRRVSLAVRESYEIKIRLVLLREMLFHKHILVNGLESYVYHLARMLRRSYVLKVVGDTAWETARNRGTTLLNIEEFQRDSLEQLNNAGLINRRNRCVKLARKVFTPSEYLRKMVIGWGVDPNRVITIPNGIEDEAVSQTEPLHRCGEKFELLFVGRLTNWKGVETLLLSVVDLRDINVTVIGDGPEYPHLVDLTKQLKLQSKVCFTGRQTQEQVHQYMSRAHVLVLTSLYEGLSHTLLEALAMGIPCVVSDYGGNKEVIVHRENGLYIPAQDVDALRSVLKMLQGDEDLRFRLACGAKLSSNKFRLRDTVREVVSLILEET